MPLSYLRRALAFRLLKVGAYELCMTEVGIVELVDFDIVKPPQALRSYVVIPVWIFHVNLMHPFVSLLL